MIKGFTEFINEKHVQGTVDWDQVTKTQTYQNLQLLGFNIDTSPITPHGVIFACFLTKANMRMTEIESDYLNLDKDFIAANIVCEEDGDVTFSIRNPITNVYSYHDKAGNAFGAYHQNPNSHVWNTTHVMKGILMAWSLVRKVRMKLQEFGGDFRYSDHPNVKKMFDDWETSDAIDAMW